MAARPRTILVGYDGSSASRRALDAVADLAGYGTTVAVVAAPRDVESPGAELRRLVDEAREALLRRNVAARCFEAEGDRAEALLEVARDLVRHIPPFQAWLAAGEALACGHVGGRPAARHHS